jgi:hypothetical protein
MAEMDILLILLVLQHFMQVVVGAAVQTVPAVLEGVARVVALQVLQQQAELA